MNEIKNLLKEKANIVDKTLEEIMEITDPDSRTLHEAMKYTLFFRRQKNQAHFDYDGSRND